MIEIKDNFFSQNAFEKIQSILLSDCFQWFYNDYKVYKAKEDNDFQFTHTLYKAMAPHSGYYGELPDELFDKLKIRLLVKIKANLSTRKHEQELSTFHVDQDIPNTFTSIFYVNSNNGCTVFEETGETINSVENRMITFPSSLYHSTLSHTDTKRRVLININYIKDL